MKKEERRMKKEEGRKKKEKSLEDDLSGGCVLGHLPGPVLGEHWFSKNKLSSSYCRRMLLFHSV
jgi:hypothetical protein